MSHVLKLINVSEVQIPVILDGGETIFLPPRGVVENADIVNLDQIKRMCRVVKDLTEVGSNKDAGTKKKAALNG
jgi:hypothetical protein